MTVLFALLETPWAWIIIAVVGVLMFGRRLPEIGRQLGRALTEFKHGMRGLEDDVTASSSQPSAPPAEAPKVPQRITGTAPKFDSAGTPVSTPESAPKS